MFGFFELLQYFDQGSCAFFSCTLTVNVIDCECNRPSVLATVFVQAWTFNGDLNTWDVAKVTDMSNSKSIRICVTSMHDMKSIRIFEDDVT